MAMSRALFDADDGGGIFECPVCLLSMTDRRTRALPCLHTFCEPCLVECAKNNQPGIITCPTCRKSTPVPPGGVTELPHNFQLDKFSALLRQENLCQNCTETLRSPPKATYFCGNCQKKYCDSCKVKHGTIPAFSDHQIVPILDDTPTNKCAFHGMALDLFCLECQECLCSSCAMKPKHSRHYDKLVNMKKEMDICCQEAAEVIGPIKQKVPSWSDSLNDMMTRLNKLSTDIREEGNKRIQHINELVGRLQYELKTDYILPVKECITCLETLKKSTEATEKIIQRKQFTPNTIIGLKKNTSGCKENKRSFENKIKRIHQVPTFVATSEISNFGYLSMEATSEGGSPRSTRSDVFINRVFSKLKMQTLIDKRPSEEERKALIRIGTRVKIGPDWLEDWTPSGEGTICGRIFCDVMLVKWDDGPQTHCRVGFNGSYDVNLA